MTAITYDELTASGAKLYFVGIGGVSMSSLALIAAASGARVEGSDPAASDTVELLRAEGITVHPQHLAEQVEGADAVVYTAAIREGNPELARARELGIPTLARAEFLGSMMSGYERRIGVAGTHGKTTVTSMTSLIMLAAGLDPTIVNGAADRSMGSAYRIGGRGHFVFEACEYTDSFLSFLPTTAVILNIEREHVDYFKTDEQLVASFKKYADIAQTVVANAACEMTVSAVKEHRGEIVWYLPAGEMPCKAAAELIAVKPKSKVYRAENIEFARGNGVISAGSFTLVRGGEELCRIELCVPGMHNVTDAVAAAAACIENGASAAAAAVGLGRFVGAERRFQPCGIAPSGAAVFDDYAHHPSEIRATLDAAARSGRTITCVFQPHTYSRTHGLFDDFAAVFSDFISSGGRVVFTDIYSASREDNTSGVTSQMLARAVEGSVYVQSLFDGRTDFSALAQYLKEHTESGEMILTLGAGSITRLAHEIGRSGQDGGCGGDCGSCDGGCGEDK